MGYIPMDLLYASGQTTLQEPEYISGFSTVVEITAMLVKPDTENGNLIYAGEQGPLGVNLNCPREIQDEQGNCFQWWRFEIYSENKSCSIGKGDSLVMADFPYAKKQIQTTTFKKGFVNNRPNPATETFESIDAAINWIDEKNKDYFLTKKGVIAAFSKPGGMLDPAKARNYSLDESMLVIGVCENFSEYVTALLKSKEVESLLRLTEGPIKLGPKDKYPNPISLPQEVKDEKYPYMYIAIRQALAGPKKESYTWVGRPVFDYINQLYRNHLFNHWRRYENERRHISDTKDYLF